MPDSGRRLGVDGRAPLRLCSYSCVRVPGCYLQHLDRYLDSPSCSIQEQQHLTWRDESIACEKYCAGP